MSLWETMTEQERFDTLTNMRLDGGGFASRLAAAWMWADSCNNARLAAAFPDLIEKFQPSNWSRPCENTP